MYMKPGMDPGGVQRTMMLLVCNACDLIRNMPAFRASRQGCPMTAVLQLFERCCITPAIAEPPGHALPLMALQLLHCVPVFWEVCARRRSCTCLPACTTPAAFLLHA
jgi:hypothetical protein